MSALPHLIRGDKMKYYLTVMDYRPIERDGIRVDPKHITRGELNYAFTWRRSPQGHAYWEAQYDAGKLDAQAQMFIAQFNRDYDMEDHIWEDPHYPPELRGIHFNPSHENFRGRVLTNAEDVRRGDLMWLFTWSRTGNGGFWNDQYHKGINVEARTKLKVWFDMHNKYMEEKKNRYPTKLLDDETEKEVDRWLARHG